MATIWKITSDALTPLGLPMAMGVYRVNSVAKYPDTYLVYKNIADVGQSHADNEENSRQYLIQVSYFSVDGLNGMPDIGAAMTAAGFTRGAARELEQNTATGHFGYAMDFYYLEDEYGT